MNIWVALKQILDPEVPTRDFAIDGTRQWPRVARPVWC